MEPLDTKKLSVGMRVIKVCGERQNTTGLVKAVDVGLNRFAVLFDGDEAVIQNCDPKEFQILISTVIRLTGRSPPHTIARGSH